MAQRIGRRVRADRPSFGSVESDSVRLLNDVEAWLSWEVGVEVTGNTLAIPSGNCSFRSDLP